MSVWKKRREALFEQLPNNSVSVLFSAKEIIRNGDAHYPFRQHSDFHYLTGFDEPLSMAIFLKEKGRVKYLIFCRESDPLKEQWEGARLGLSSAKSTLGADEVYEQQYFEKIFHEVFQPGFELFCLPDAKWRLRALSETVPHDLGELLHPLRRVKSKEEIALIQKAVDISVDAHVAAMQRAPTAKWEYELEAALLERCVMQGARHVAYPSIVAAGNNACILHYTENNAAIKKKDLILIDAGAEYEYYAADITRTFPASGKFSAPQQAIYELVLEAQLAGIAAAQPGAAFSAVQTAILSVMVPGLVALGILKGDPDGLIEEKGYVPYYMHGSGHWLGLDVHDVSAYQTQDRASTILAPGMVLTIEPGLYFMPHLSVAKKWQGIGVRIEDDILITAKGNTVLSAACPKAVKEIEHCIS